MRATHMSGETPVNRDRRPETFAAELNLAAYRVALRTRTRGTWLDQALDPWRALADTVESGLLARGSQHRKRLPARRSSR